MVKINEIQITKDLLKEIRDYSGTRGEQQIPIITIDTQISQNIPQTQYETTLCNFENLKL